MLKFLFSILVLANVALAAYQFGYLDTLLPSGHEPARIDRQIAPERIRIVPEPLPQPTPPEPPPSSSAAEAPVVTVTETAAGAATTAAAPACVEVGNFNQEEGRRFIAALGELGARASTRNLQEVATHMVYMPPQADREAAEKKAGELRRLGVEDFFIIQDNSSLRWGISLGVFKTEEAARTHLARLNQKGVRSARIGQRTVSATQVAFQFTGLDAGARATLDKAKAEFARQELRDCPAAT